MQAGPSLPRPTSPHPSLRAPPSRLPAPPLPDPHRPTSPSRVRPGQPMPCLADIPALAETSPPRSTPTALHPPSLALPTSQPGTLQSCPRRLPQSDPVSPSRHSRPTLAEARRPSPTFHVESARSNPAHRDFPCPSSSRLRAPPPTSRSLSPQPTPPRLTRSPRTPSTHPCPTSQSFPPCAEPNRRPDPVPPIPARLPLPLRPAPNRLPSTYPAPSVRQAYTSHVPSTRLPEPHLHVPTLLDKSLRIMPHLPAPTTQAPPRPIPPSPPRRPMS